MKTLSLLFIFLLTGITVTAAFGGENNRNLQSSEKKIAAVIVGHGSMAADFPKKKEYFALHNKGGEQFEQIERELLAWPRTKENDAYWAGFMEIVNQIRQSNMFASVHSAFNEMCAPTVYDALNEALQMNPDVIIVTPVMVTPGGGHSEKDIPSSIEQFKKDHPQVEVVYAWPFAVSDVARLFIEQTNKFVPKP